METDSLVAISLVNMEPNNLFICGHVDECQSVFTSFPNDRLAYVRKEANGCADALGEQTEMLSSDLPFLPKHYEKCSVDF